MAMWGLTVLQLMLLMSSERVGEGLPRLSEAILTSFLTGLAEVLP
jgi:hypothetical protein